MNSFYWHDYETWGINPALDKPSQFAGVRTDLDFNIIGEPCNILCRPSLDTLPSVEACLITGITPQKAEEHGLSEREFFARIHQELSLPGTCGLGYNSIRFDDEVSRYGFYRNFYDPYAREWQQGNSRWDIIDMVRLCHAVRPEGIEWPKREDGFVSLKLELLSKANGIEHLDAHDALSDVYATIGIAKLIKSKQPKLYEHVFSLRPKRNVLDALEIGSYQPKLHISSKFGSEFSGGSLILPVTVHPKNKNEVLCIDLRYDPSPILELDATELARLIFSPLSELPDSIGRIPWKSVHINRCPIVLSPGLIDEKVSERLKLDLPGCERHRQQLIAFSSLKEKCQEIAESMKFKPNTHENDVECQLYQGFFSPSDRNVSNTIPAKTVEELREQTIVFEDDRLTELLFRYKARNFPEALAAEEQAEWLEFCWNKLMENDTRSIHTELDKITQLTATENSKQSLEKDSMILGQLEDYLENKAVILKKLMENRFEIV